MLETKPPASNHSLNSITYEVQSGDTLNAIAGRFGVEEDKISSLELIPERGLLRPGQHLSIPETSSPESTETVIKTPARLIPDSEVVYGPSSVDFDVADYLTGTGGYLGTYREYLGSTAWTSAADVITRIALENSINPRLLISLLEHECGCVLGVDSNKLQDGYVLGVEEFRHRWLYRQLGWAINQLSIGYYGWRSGSLTEIPLVDGTIIRPAPDSNAGTVALVYYFASLAAQKELQKHPQGVRENMATLPLENGWMEVLDPKNGYPALHARMFPDPWQRARTVEPLFPGGLGQPEWILPFEIGYPWSLASGPHKAWQTDGALAALDFAPGSKHSGCVRSKAWIVAAGDGPVVRVGNGYVIQDLNSSPAGDQPTGSDGKEQTGWAILYMHIASEDKVPLDTNLQQGDKIGHPSCEGGPATGTHTHLARKYNGEWVDAGGPLPFELSGWVVKAGAAPYEGSMTKDDMTIFAHPWGSFDTVVMRSDGSSPEIKTFPPATPFPNAPQKNYRNDGP